MLESVYLSRLSITPRSAICISVGFVFYLASAWASRRLSSEANGPGTNFVLHAKIIFIEQNINTGNHIENKKVRNRFLLGFLARFNAFTEHQNLAQHPAGKFDHVVLVNNITLVNRRLGNSIECSKSTNGLSGNICNKTFIDIAQDKARKKGAISF